MSEGGVIPALVSQVIVISLKREKGEPFRRQGKKLVMEKELMQLRFNDAIFSEFFWSNTNYISLVSNTSFEKLYEYSRVRIWSLNIVR